MSKSPFCDLSLAKLRKNVFCARFGDFLFFSLPVAYAIFLFISRVDFIFLDFTVIVLFDYLSTSESK